MELRDLNADEKVALAALLEFVILASGTVTEDEEREIDALVEEMGDDAYRRSMEEVDRRFPDEESVKKFLKTITRQEARELIYGTVIEAAMADRVEGRESDMLEWVAAAWNVEVTYEEPPAGANE
jgi:hypothetical protein